MSDNRIWRIDGILTTVTPLHIGDGATTTHEKLKDKDEDIEITSVVKDINGRAYIPATSIKGNVRAWLEKQNCVCPNILDNLFGSKDLTKESKENTVGGKAEFWNAFALTEQDINTESPYWNPERLTDIGVSVSIDRQLLTAIKSKLFHYEFVPPGVKFQVTVVVHYANEDEIIPLIYAFECGFSSNDPIVIGASESNGWGKLNWELQDITKIDPDDVAKWLNDNSIDKKCDFVPLSQDEMQTLKKKAKEFGCTELGSSQRIKIRLEFKGLFLVNDFIIKDEKDKEDEENKKPDHKPRKNYQNKVIIPAASFRGAFRSQAERIIRTLGGNACSPSEPCKKENPCLACLIFGATDRKSFISFTDFVQCNEEKSIRQEFVAIDRFTGGGANKQKFNADAVLDPTFEGEIILNTKVEDWMKGLLALTIRDLQEGDITFGFGASKGYGRCEAKTDFLVEENKEYINDCVRKFRELINKKGESDV